jgi:hypothetical protein
VQAELPEGICAPEIDYIALLQKVVKSLAIDEKIEE